MDPNIRTLLLKRFISLMGIEITEYKKTFSKIEFTEYPGQEYHMISAGGRGIYKPKDSPYTLSIRCDLVDNPYDDEIFFDDEGNFKKLIYHGPTSKKLENRAKNDIASLIACYEDNIPFGIILTLDKKKAYQSLGLGIIKSHNDNIYEIIPYKLIEKDENSVINKETETLNFYDNLDDIKVTEKMYNLKVRTVQSQFRKKLLNKNNKCLLCDFQFKPLLYASHIKPWSVSNDSERLDINNGFLLCPLHDKLFDKGYISFQNNEIIYYKRLDDSIISTIKYRKFQFNAHQINYLNYHKKHIFKND